MRGAEIFMTSIYYMKMHWLFGVCNQKQAHSLAAELCRVYLGVKI